MSTLHERLADLATDAPTPTPDPLLWDRAARFHRRRRAGTAGILAVAVLAVLSLVGIDTWQRSPGVEPAAPGTEPVLPARFWEPSPWLPGTGGEPTGPLAALITAERKGWLSTSDGVVGVSATTGEYRFLDLPDDSTQAWALSPDGSKVAYWVTGETARSPYTAGGQYSVAVGVAVWDATTGEVQRHEVESDHGLATGDLLWADARHVVVSWTVNAAGDTDGPQRRRGGSYAADGLRVWEPDGSAGPVSFGLPWTIGADTTNGRGQVLLETRGRQVLDVDTGARSGFEGGGARYGWVSALSPDGSALAYPKGASNPNRLFLAEAGREPRLVLDEKVWAAVGWLDEDTLAFLTRDTRQDPIPATIETISLSTGERGELIAGGSFQPLPGNLATDLLAVEPRDFPEPSSPWSPRVVAGLVGFVLVISGLWVWGWRRRVQP